MITFDGHIDTLLRLLQTGRTLDQNEGHVTLERLQAGGVSAQIFAVFVEPPFYQGMSLHRGLEMIDLFWEILDKFPDDLGYAGTGTDVENLQKEGKIACLLAVEGGEVVEGKLAHLRNLYRLGVRVMTLTWNYRNAIANGQVEGEKSGGLSPFGLEVISEMNRLGMLVDVSHLNEPGFWDVIDVSNDPVIASHSCAKVLCDHARNLTDDQIRALAERGGVIGVNFYPGFLSESGKADVDDVIRHIQHFIKVGGIECVGLGSDFDGINSTPRGLESCDKMKLIPDYLDRVGLSPSDIDKVMGLNFLRVTKQVLG